MRVCLPDQARRPPLVPGPGLPLPSPPPSPGPAAGPADPPLRAVRRASAAAAAAAAASPLGAGRAPDPGHRTPLYVVVVPLFFRNLTDKFQ
jgi:hypothetical protein